LFPVIKNPGAVFPQRSGLIFKNYLKDLSLPVILSLFSKEGSFIGYRLDYTPLGIEVNNKYGIKILLVDFRQILS